MKIHESKYENEGWINTASKLPELRKRVKLASIHIVDWNIEGLNWESEGWLTDFGVFSVKKSETATKDAVFKHATTHWKEII